MVKGMRAIVLVLIMALSFTTCCREAKEDLEVNDAADARDAVLAYLQQHEPQDAPTGDITWQEEDVTPRDEAGHPVPGAVHMQFTSDEWTIKVSYAVLPLEHTVYEVILYSIKLGWHWKGNVKADGTVIKLSAFRQMSKVDVSCDDFMELQHISKEVEDAVNGILMVILCSNPSTGFQWTESAQISDQTVLQQTNHELVMPKPEPPPPPGTPGQEVWIFEVIKKGSSTISMEYSRPWEGGEKGEWTFSLTVLVK